MINENGIANLLMDVDFLDEELKRNGHSHGAAFTELRSVRSSCISISIFPTLFLSLPPVLPP